MHDENRPQLVEGASDSRAAAVTRAQSFASASDLDATCSAQSFASAAGAPSAGIVLQAWRYIGRLIVVTAATLGQAAHLPRRGQATYADPHLGKGVQHRRRRRRRLAARMLAMCQGYPRRRAVPSLSAACGRVNSIRGSSLHIWAMHGICRNCFRCSRDMAMISTASILAPSGASSNRLPMVDSAGSAIALRPCASRRPECFPS